MAKGKRTAEEQKKMMDLVRRFQKNNRGVDLYSANLVSQAKLEGYNWTGLKRDKEALITELKSWQRLARVLPDKNNQLLKKLLRHKITSALEIAAIPREEFKRRFLKVFGNDEELLHKTHKRARAIRSHTMLMYIEKLQSKEPHFRRANLSA